VCFEMIYADHSSNEFVRVQTSQNGKSKCDNFLMYALYFFFVYGNHHKDVL
jgi:hypothetical protein